MARWWLNESDKNGHPHKSNTSSHPCSLIFEIAFLLADIAMSSDLIVEIIFCLNFIVGTGISTSGTVFASTFGSET